MIICAYCKGEFIRQNFGRDPKYCCHGCRQLAYTARIKEDRRRAIRQAIVSMTYARECPDGCSACQALLKAATEVLSELPEAQP